MAVNLTSRGNVKGCGMVSELVRLFVPAPYEYDVYCSCLLVDSIADPVQAMSYTVVRVSTTLDLGDAI